MGAGHFGLEVCVIDNDAAHYRLPSLSSAQRDGLSSPLRLCERHLFQRDDCGKESKAENAEPKAILPFPDSHRQKRNAGVAHGKLQKVSTLAYY
jgi:hypothetical protein